MTRLYTSIIACCLLGSAALAQTAEPRSYNTTLFGQISPAQGSGGRYSALTGYAHPNGREYALLGGYNGTHIIDVTEQPIHQVAFIPGPASGWREMKAYGNYGYVVSEGGGGLQIIDLSKLPQEATLVRSDTSIFFTAHTISQHGTYLYVNGTGVNAGANGGTLIYDLSKDPLRPEHISTWSLRYVHDAVVRNDTLYASAINNGKLDIVYLGDGQKNPQLVNSIEYPGAGTHNADLTPDGSYVMTTDEIGSTPKTLKVWDVRDVENISKVADWTPVPGQIIHNVHMKGSIAYIAWYTAGTRVVDMSNPLDPAELGFYDTYPGASATYSGNWEVYPYLPSGKILSSDMQTGLHVFTFNGAARGNVYGVVRDALTNEPVSGAVISIAETGRTIVTDAQGGYSLAGAIDTLDFRIAKRDYISSTGSLILSADGTRHDILLTSIPMMELSMTVVDKATGEALPRFSYRVVERPESAGLVAGSSKLLRLPRDSSFHVYVGAWGYRSQVVDISPGQSGEHRVEVIREYYDDVELDLGWSLAAPGDNAASGRWERGVPMESSYPDGTLFQPGSDHTGGLGDHAFITGLFSEQFQPGVNDVDDGVTTLTSPPMNLVGYDDPVLSCAIWYSRNGRVDAINDTLEVLISSDNGESWHTLARITESPQVWKNYRFRLKDFITPGEATRFRVVASDLYEQSLVEAGLDDFSVVDSSSAPSSVPLLPGASAGVVASYQLRPNPFAGVAQLDLTLAAEQKDARLELFDALGRQVGLLHEGAIPAGTSSYTIDGSAIPAGRYAWRLTLDNGQVCTGAATLVR